MGGIAGMAELLLESGLDPVQRGYARGVHGAVLELTHIINDVLDFSKIESGHMTLERLPFDPAAQLAQVAALHQAAAARKGLRIALRTGEGPRLVYGDAARLRQILGNLLSNAIKFADAGVIALDYSVDVDPRAAGLWRLRYVVGDEGIGMDEAAQRRLFEPFSQADETISGRYGGTGLGLAICKHLLELMGGGISCVSAPGAGTRFTVELPAPLAVEQSGPPAVEQTEPPAVERAEPAAAPGVVRTALVADDNEMNRQLARVLLAKMGWNAELVDDGRQAVDAFARGRHDLVLMDCMMPVMNGYEACGLLRRAEAENGWPRVPVVALTASAVDGDRQRCLDAGMDDYLSKPFTAEQFREMIRRWSDGPAPAAASSDR
jgi:CheY-like chemotaxis protein/two-component sensor histidine kinase